MATYREFIYMVLDELKLPHDDAFYTEAHAAFLLKRARAMLLERKYGRFGAGRGQSALPEADLQEVCLDLELSEGTDGVCGTGAGKWLRSVQEVPSLLDAGTPRVYPLNAMLGEKFSFVPIQRLRFVGGNRWLKRFVYAALGPDRHLYVAGGGTGWRYMTKLRLAAAFEDPEEALALSCDGSDAPCDPLDMEFPLEAALQAACVEYAVQTLSGSRYAPEDRANDAKDGLAEASVTNVSTPALDAEKKEAAQ